MPRLYAHRGAAAELPENTLPSFHRALDVGADALEMDAHLSVDGEVVISHDASGERMAGVPRAIREATLSEIKTWDVGLEWAPSRPDDHRPGGGFEIPTLDEVLEEFPHTVINIDLKDHRRELVTAVLDVIAGHHAAHRVQLASFDLGTLLDVRRRGYPGKTAMAPPELAAALVLPSPLYRLLPWTGQCAQIPSRREFLEQPGSEIGGILGLQTRSERLAELPKRLFPSDRWLVGRLHRLGLQIDVWTINDPEEARTLAALGVDGIMTDDPRAIAIALDKQHAE